MELTDQVRETMAEVFEVDASALAPDASHRTCAAWTSLNNMLLQVALEEKYGVSFSMDEMMAMTSLPKIVAVLQRRGVVA
jgi:acyl carrier protein